MYWRRAIINGPEVAAPVLPASSRKNAKPSAAKTTPIQNARTSPEAGNMQEELSRTADLSLTACRQERRTLHEKGPDDAFYRLHTRSPLPPIIPTAPASEQNGAAARGLKTRPLSPDASRKQVFTRSSCTPARRKKRLPRLSYPCPGLTSGRLLRFHASFLPAPIWRRNAPNGFH